MFYKPGYGRIKDSCLLYDQGRFYLFGMFSRRADQEAYSNVWMAESEDGVHFSDVGTVIEAPFEVWAMSVIRIGESYWLNHGSFTRPGIQNVIRFWESKDLRNWTYHPELDLHPDERWNAPDSRLDCMDIVPVEEKGRTRYYGFATGPGGFLVSDDGIHWEGVKPAEIDWTPVTPPPIPAEEGGLEVGGCRKIGDRYYLVGGWFNYMGFTGYGTYTLTADSPHGPFHPDFPAFRLCGNSRRWVSLWARFCDTPDGLLISNSYIYTGYSYEQGETWVPPVKRAKIDADGHLRLVYWEGNERVKGEELPLNPSRCEGAGAEVADGVLTLTAAPEVGSLSLPLHGKPWTLALSPEKFDPAAGFVIEGEIECTCRDRRLVAPAAGFYLEEAEGRGSAILLESQGITRIGRLIRDSGTGEAFDCEEEILPYCAAPAGIEPHCPHRFRLLVRLNLFELYLDDRFVQSFNTTHEPGTIGTLTGRIGWICCNGIARFSKLRAWAMNFEPYHK